MSECEEKKECPICVNEDVILISPSDSKSSHPELNITCDHRMCISCWKKISFYEEVVCPFCRENLEAWFEKCLGMYIFKNDGKGSFNEKRVYASHLANLPEDEELDCFVIEDDETCSKEIFFFNNNVFEDSDCELCRGVVNVFLGGKKYREIGPRHYIVNEYSRNFSHDKMKRIALIMGEIEGNSFSCFCGVKVKINNIDTHLESFRHKQFIFFVVDKNFHRYSKLFHHINLNEYDDSSS
jgi:hypothetical protein